MIRIRVINLSNRRLDLGMGVILEPKKTIFLAEDVSSYIKARIASFAAVGVVKAFNEEVPDVNNENTVENNVDTNVNDTETSQEETPKKSNRKK